MDGKQLKNSILQWAIQGKLVPQNPKDEPASKLLERIAKVRNESLSPWSEAIGSTKRSKKSAATSCIYRENGVWYEQVGNAEPKDVSDDIPFEIPENWVWCRLAQLAEIQSSKRVFEKDYVATGIPFFRSKEIGELSRGESIHTELYITKQHYKELKEKYGVPQIGDILLTSVGSIGNLWICDGREFYYKDGNVTQICGNSCFDSQYVALYLSSPFFFEQIRSSVAGTAYNALTIIKLKSLILPLPPLAEQKRIVAKLEQVLPLADEYGAAQEKLDKLNKELPEALKKSFLQQAIQGKLVPQKTKDEPASVLLAKIRKEKETLVKQGLLKKNALEEIPIDEEEIPFEIPDTWAWCRLGDIFDHKNGKQLNTANKNGQPRKYITTSNLYWDHFKLDNLKTMYFTNDELDRCTATKGDLLVCEGGDIGRAAIWNEDFDICIQNHIHKLRAYIDVCIKFFWNVLFFYKKTGLIGGKGIGIQGLSSKALHNILIPLPPLAEQKRIVAKLEQLFKVL